MRSIRLVFLLIVLVIFAPVDAALAQLVDGAPGNHVEIDGTTIDIFVPLHVLVPKPFYDGTDPRDKQRLKKAIDARIRAGVKRFRETVQKQLDREPLYRGCYRFKIRGRWQIIFAANGDYAFHDTPYHALTLSREKVGQAIMGLLPGDPYRQSLFGSWGIHLHTDVDVLDAINVKAALLDLLGMDWPPSARELGDKVNELYKQKTGEDLPGCYELTREWTEQGTTISGGTLGGHGRSILTVAPSQSGDGTLKGSGSYQSTGWTDVGWREWQKGTFNVTGTLDGDYLRLTLEDWVILSRDTVSGFHPPIHSQSSTTTVVGPLMDGFYEGTKTVNGFSRGAPSVAFTSPTVRVQTRYHTVVREHKGE